MDELFSLRVGENGRQEICISVKYIAGVLVADTWVDLSDYQDENIILPPGDYYGLTVDQPVTIAEYKRACMPKPLSNMDDRSPITGDIADE